MFDTIVVQCNLPMPEDPMGYSGSSEFQTKDLENCLLNYKIDKDGLFFVEKQTIERVPGNKNAKSILDRIGSMKIIERWWEKYDISNKIRFYDYKTTNKDFDYDIEYEAQFLNGKLVEVKLFKFKAIENTSRKKMELAFKKEMFERRKFINSFKYKFFFRFWNSLLRFISRVVSKMSTFIVSHCNKMHV